MNLYGPKVECERLNSCQFWEMIKFQNNSSFNNKLRTIVIDDLEFLNLNSSNALLKSLEEPNDNIVYFLINNSEYKILDTIRSRCINYIFDNLSIFYIIW